MKGDKAKYSIDLRNAFMFPATKRIRKALNEIKAFAKKHTRASEVMISNEVNEKVHENSKNIPRRLEAVLYKEGQATWVFMQGGEQLEAHIQKKVGEKKKKEEKKAKQEKETDKGEKVNEGEKGGKAIAKEAEAGKAKQGEGTGLGKGGGQKALDLERGKGFDEESLQDEGEEEKKRRLEEKRAKENAGEAIIHKRG